MKIEDSKLKEARTVFKHYFRAGLGPHIDPRDIIDMEAEIDNAIDDIEELISLEVELRAKELVKDELKAVSKRMERVVGLMENTAHKIEAYEKRLGVFGVDKDGHS